MLKKEIYWLIGTLTVVLISTLSIVGLKSLRESTLDVNIHDTYFVITLFPVIILYGSFALFVVYLYRVFRNRFKNFVANYIFLIADLALIVVCTKLTGVLSGIAQIGGTSGNMSLNEEISKIELNWARDLSNILILFQFILLCLLAYTGIKIGLNYKHNK